MAQYQFVLQIKNEIILNIIALNKNYLQIHQYNMIINYYILYLTMTNY